MQALDKYVKAPLSSSRSTKNVRVALETNGRYAIKTGAPGYNYSVHITYVILPCFLTAVQTALFRLASTFSKERRYNIDLRS